MAFKTCIVLLSMKFFFISQCAANEVEKVKMMVASLEGRSVYVFVLRGNEYTSLKEFGTFTKRVGVDSISIASESKLSIKDGFGLQSDLQKFGIKLCNLWVPVGDYYEGNERVIRKCIITKELMRKGSQRIKKDIKVNF